MSTKNLSSYLHPLPTSILRLGNDGIFENEAFLTNFYVLAEDEKNKYVARIMINDWNNMLEIYV